MLEDGVDGVGEQAGGVDEGEELGGGWVGDVVEVDTEAWERVF